MDRRWDVWGALAGLGLGMCDTALLLASGVEMSIAGMDATLAVGATFSSSFALLGWLVGRLWILRARARVDADTIARQQNLAALGRVAAGIAHEVRNPLSVIRASAGVVQEHFEPTDEAWRACQFVVEEIDRLNRLIVRLLAFARPGELVAAPVEVGKLADRALVLADEELRAKDARVVRALDPGLRELRADPDLAAQLLLGLLVNAAEAIAGGGRVELRSRRDGEHALFEVADDGPGIPAEHGARVFEPFFTTKATGTGLGLAMAQRIAAAHDGALEVVQGAGAGANGSGACVRARLPLAGPRGAGKLLA